MMFQVGKLKKRVYNTNSWDTSCKQKGSEGDEIMEQKKI